MSREKTASKENAVSVFDKLAHVKDEIAGCLYEIDTMVKLGEESGHVENENQEFVIDWPSVFRIIGRIQKTEEEKIDELDRLITELRIGEQKATTGLKRFCDIS